MRVSGCDRHLTYLVMLLKSGCGCGLVFGRLMLKSVNSLLSLSASLLPFDSQQLLISVN